MQNLMLHNTHESESTGHLDAGQQLQVCVRFVWLLRRPALFRPHVKWLEPAHCRLYLPHTTAASLLTVTKSTQDDMASSPTRVGVDQRTINSGPVPLAADILQRSDGSIMTQVSAAV